MSSEPILSFGVLGTPVQQGSMKGYARGGKAHLTATNDDELKPWRGDVRDAALRAMKDRELEWETLLGPVQINVLFVFQRPKKHFRTGKLAHLLREDAPMLHAGTPDLDKLARAINDALTEAGVWRDDCQVAQLYASKAWTMTTGPVDSVSRAGGAYISVTDLGDGR